MTSWGYWEYQRDDYRTERTVNHLFIGPKATMCGIFVQGEVYLEDESLGRCKTCQKLDSKRGETTDDS